MRTRHSELILWMVNTEVNEARMPFYKLMFIIWASSGLLVSSI